MTNRLKDLMTEAADELVPYAPDLNALVREGRRRVRQRRLLTCAAAVVLIAIANRTVASQ